MQLSRFNKYRLKGAYHYEWFEKYNWYQTIIRRGIKFCDGSTLELGCGDGLFIGRVKNNGYDVLGVDNDHTGLRLAYKMNPQLKKHDLLEADIDKLNIDPEVKFDYLACINTIEHLNNPEVILRILDSNITKGAYITTIDYQGGSLGEDHKREYTAEQFVEFFSNYKLKFFVVENIWIGVEIKL